MANLIKQKEKTTISTIRDSAGKPTQSPEEINQIFRDFYAKLYLPEIDPTRDDINNINLPQLSPDQITTLESPIINNYINNKSPGRGGFPTEFYKHFWSILTQLFNRLVTEIKQTQIYQKTRIQLQYHCFLNPTKIHHYHQATAQSLLLMSTLKSLLKHSPTE